MLSYNIEQNTKNYVDGPVFEISEIQNLDVTQLFQRVKKEGYVSMRGLFPKDQLREIVSLQDKNGNSSPLLQTVAP